MSECDERTLSGLVTPLGEVAVLGPEHPPRPRRVLQRAFARRRRRCGALSGDRTRRRLVMQVTARVLGVVVQP
jgi:hypothetical protein